MKAIVSQIWVVRLLSSQIKKVVTDVNADATKLPYKVTKDNSQLVYARRIIRPVN